MKYDPTRTSLSKAEWDAIHKSNWGDELDNDEYEDAMDNSLEMVPAP